VRRSPADAFLIRPDGHVAWAAARGESDASAVDDKHYISHIGMYIGTDSNADARFVSGRQIVNGPAFGTDDQLVP
jgi:hypothetical protein